MWWSGSCSCNKFEIFTVDLCSVLFLSSLPHCALSAPSLIVSLCMCVCYLYERRQSQSQPQPQRCCPNLVAVVAFAALVFLFFFFIFSGLFLRCFARVKIFRQCAALSLLFLVSFCFCFLSFVQCVKWQFILPVPVPDLTHKLLIIIECGKGGGTCGEKVKTICGKYAK